VLGLLFRRIRLSGAAFAALNALPLFRKVFRAYDEPMSSDPDPAAAPFEVFADGVRKPACREWVAEEPVALEYNGLSYAVMMGTPQDLEDFATGFALSEGLAGSAREVRDCAVAQTDLGWIVRTSLAGLGADQMADRVRTRVAESSCGLCGIENLEAVARPLPPVAPHTALDPQAIFTALAALRFNPSRCSGRWANLARCRCLAPEPARPTPPPGRMRTATSTACARTSGGTTRWTS